MNLASFCFTDVTFTVLFMCIKKSLIRTSVSNFSPPWSWLEIPKLALEHDRKRPVSVVTTQNMQENYVSTESLLKNLWKNTKGIEKAVTQL